MWLFNSSIGRKLVMAITGACLVLFVTFHVLMNSVALIWPTAYNQVCEFLGANWYALIASAGLAALFVIHIVYAVWLTMQNRKARGNDRYAVTSRPPQVEWASKNMLVLGIVILAFLVVHLIQFWAKMQWQELRHAELSVLPQLENGIVLPSQGTLFLQIAFSEVWTPIVYIIGFIALWFHMNHGFWSMFQSTGWNGQSWIPRLKKIACWWTTIVVALFIAQAIVFTVRAHQKYYLSDLELQEQYAEAIGDTAEPLVLEFNGELNKFQKEVQDFMQSQQGNPNEIQEMQTKFLETKAVAFLQKASPLVKTYEIRCPDVEAAPESYSKLEAAYNQFQMVCAQYGIEIPTEATSSQDNNQK
ncbi:MAG: succinate dehydrogenase cytochrome b subunit [Muribaculaceae bacterium]|nr:succinate dehydrogenase cytochrome b subunit [Muribaculaceae bacterium]